jgi:acyl-CoA synthetase (AMP-forming)/AMP-acid ligase II
MCAAHGAAFISDTFFEASAALALIELERPTILYPAYPPITQALLTHPKFTEADLSAARAMLNVGPPDLLRQMQTAMPHVVQLSLYGLTEGGGAITYNRLDDDLEVRVETCGGCGSSEGSLICHVANGSWWSR